VRVELGHVGILPVWEDNNRNEMAMGRAKTAVIKPVLIDREIPAVQAKLDELSKQAAPPAPPEGTAAAKTVQASASAGLTPEQKKQFIELTSRLKLLTDRRAQILARTGDEYVTAPPKLPVKP